jgi:hypothetical protein
MCWILPKISKIPWIYLLVVFFCNLQQNFFWLIFISLQCENSQYVTLHKYFSRSKFRYLLFPTPPIKLKLGLQTRGTLTTNSNAPGPIKLSSQSTACVRLLLCPLPTSAAACAKNALPKPFCSAKPTHFDFSSSNVLLQHMY